MGDNIANQDNISYGLLGAIQLSDGAGKFTSTSKLKINSLSGQLTASSYIGDGGLLSNITGGGGGGYVMPEPYSYGGADAYSM